MSLPFEYESVTPGEFGGTKPTTTDFENARVVILPVPLDRTTSYVPGTRLGPHEILVASSHMELWDEETETDVHSVGIYTMPEMELPCGTMDEVVKEIRRVTAEIVKRDKFPVVLGGEHSITPPVVAAIAATAGPVIECSPPSRTGNFPCATISVVTRRISRTMSSIEE